ncbi:MAG: threonine-phosphate decarboxylase CobD [Thermoleophilia bacterium]
MKDLTGIESGAGAETGAGADAGAKAGAQAGAPAHGGRREEAARRFGFPKEELLDFSASINLLGPSPAALSAIRAATVDIHYYPEETAEAFARQMASFLGVFPDEIVPGNGSIEVIYWLAATLKPAKVLIVEPTFSEYRSACEAADAQCDSFMLEEHGGFAFEAGRLDPSGYDLVFACNPNNPTGYLTPIDELAHLWRRCREAGAGLVIDEAFIDFSGPEQSILSYGVAEGMYVIRSLTKSHALAGLRLGCLVTDADFAARLRAKMPPWNMNSFALAAAEASLTDWDYLPRSRQENAAARAGLFDDLEAIAGIEPLVSEANYLLCRLTGIGSQALAEELGRQGILVRDCRSFAGLGDRYVRIAVRSERENFQLVSAIKKVFK